MSDPHGKERDMPARMGSGNLRGALRLVARLDSGVGVSWRTLSNAVHFETLQRLVRAGSLTSPHLDPATARPRPGMTNPVFLLTRFGRQVVYQLSQRSSGRRPVYIGCVGGQPTPVVARGSGRSASAGRRASRRRPEPRRHRRYQTEQW